MKDGSTQTYGTRGRTRAVSEVSVSTHSGQSEQKHSVQSERQTWIGTPSLARSCASSRNSCRTIYLGVASSHRSACQSAWAGHERKMEGRILIGAKLSLYNYVGERPCRIRGHGQRQLIHAPAARDDEMDRARERMKIYPSLWLSLHRLHSQIITTSSYVSSIIHNTIRAASPLPQPLELPQSDTSVGQCHDMIGTTIQQSITISACVRE